MRNLDLSRREILTQALPAAAALGAGLLTMNALAQGGGAGQGGPIHQSMLEAYSGGEYQLPKLPYAYDALEPAIDAKTLQLHHDKHHKAYVDNLNKAVKGLAELQKSADIDPARLAGLERDLSFNGGGHTLHTLFWATMAPKAGGEPKGPLAEAISKQFGSFDAFQNYFSKVAAGIKGSGWALLSYDAVGDQLAVFAVKDHDAYLTPGTLALLPLDVWEHAYYLKYQNVRADFIKAWWGVVNWEAVGAAYAHFRHLVKGAAAQP